MVDKKLSEFPDISADDVAKLICLYLDENNAIKNGKVDFATLNALLVHKAGQEEITGAKTFSGQTVFSGQATFNQTINADISGSSLKATGDGDGNTISSTYAKLGSANTFTGNNTFTGSTSLSSATATTPSSATDNSTKIPTTSWVRNHRCTTAASTTSTASIDAPAYVVENYRNGDSWYRVYSDGWIEQGGRFAYPTSDTDKQVNLIKAFSNTNYCVLLAGTAQSSANTAGKAYVSSRSTSSFTAHFRGQEDHNHCWIAFGQGVIPS